MNKMSSLPSFGLGPGRSLVSANKGEGGPTIVGQACANVLLALALFSEIIESDERGSGAMDEREALGELGRRIKAVRHQPCQTLDDYNSKCLTYGALKAWFPPHDTRMHVFASDLIQEFCQFFQQDEAVSEEQSVRAESIQARVAPPAT